MDLLKQLRVLSGEKAFGKGKRALEEGEVRRAMELKQLGLSDQRVAQMTGLNRATVARLFRGRTPREMIQAMVMREARELFRSDARLRGELVRPHLEWLAEREAVRRLRAERRNEKPTESDGRRKGTSIHEES